MHCKNPYLQYVVVHEDRFLIFDGPNDIATRVRLHRDSIVISLRYHAESAIMKSEHEVTGLPGLPMVFVNLALTAASIWLFILGIQQESVTYIISALVLFFITAFLWNGLAIVEPNGSKVLLLFGSYKGTLKKDGLFLVNPFITKRNLSLRVQNLNGEKLKVNDAAGNPIEIATIVVWRIVDTYTSSFAVENVYEYVRLQTETALRHSASSYPYDGDEHTESLRRNSEEVSVHLKKELQEKLSMAGVEVIDAKLSHLAYAPEIAGAMLRRQQAEAVIAARSKIVDGAVSMVEMALERMDKEGVIKLDEERKAAMVSNLMVVLCSEHSATPVVNTGTLYN